MYRNNYLIKTQSGIYKSKNAIYESGKILPDLVDQQHIHSHYTNSSLVTNPTIINFAIGSNIKLALRLKNE
jgi:hypothetical protein